MSEVAKELISYVGGKLADKFIDSFRRNVIERWSRRRAEEFFEAFVAAVVSPDIAPNEIESRLSELIADEEKSEVLFDAYRRVCLSRAKVVGPRAIGLLTGRIIGEGRVASGIEETWFQVFEDLDDMELLAAQDFYAAAFSKARSGKKTDYYLHARTLEIEWTVESANFNEENVDRSLLNLHEALGPWAAKLERLGLISVRQVETVRDLDTEFDKHITADGKVRMLAHKIVLQREDEACFEIVLKAQPSHSG